MLRRRRKPELRSGRKMLRAYTQLESKTDYFKNKSKTQNIWGFFLQVSDQFNSFH